MTRCGATLGGLTCELPRDHEDIHQMGKCRWNDVTCSAALPETAYMVAIPCVLPEGHAEEHRGAGGVRWVAV